MARISYSRNSYDGGAVQASLATALTDGVGTTVVLANTSASWDSLGTTNGFWLSIGYGLQSEEKVYVPAQGSAPPWSTGSVTLNNVVRGQDGTIAQVHDAAVPVVIVMTATDLDEANYAVTQTVGKVTAQGDILYGSGDSALTALAAGANNSVLSANGSNAAPSWKTIASILSGALPTSITTSKVWNPTATTTSTGPLQASITGYNNYIILAWSKATTTTATAAQLSLSISANSVTGINSVTQTIGGSSNETAMTAAFVNPGAGVTFSAQCVPSASGGTVSSWVNYLIVIGLN